MNEVRVVEKGIVPVYESENRRVVNARELHEFLGVGKDFSTWLKDRIEKYEFAEGEDYVEVFPNFGENSSLTDKGGRPTKDYLLTLDTAKELAMVENNEKGRQARKYFIACEKRLKEAMEYGNFYDRIPKSFPDALRALAAAEEERAALTSKIEEDRPKVAFAEAVATSDTSISINVLSKLLKQKGINIGQNRLFEILRQEGYLMRQGSDKNIPTQKAMEMGLFEVKEYTIQTSPEKPSKIRKTPKVTGKGQRYFLDRFLLQSQGREKETA